MCLFLSTVPFLLVHIQKVKVIFVDTENCGSDYDVPWGKISATMTHVVALLSLFSTHFCVGLKPTWRDPTAALRNQVWGKSRCLKSNLWDWISRMAEVLSEQGRCLLQSSCCRKRSAFALNLHPVPLPASSFFRSLKIPVEGGGGVEGGK